MARIIGYIAASLDGFIADRDARLDWLLEFGFDDFQEQYDTFFDTVGAIVMGAGTFRWLAAEGESWGYRGVPAWVVARDELPDLPGAEYQLSADPIAAVVAARSAADTKNVWIVGGGMLASTLADAGELDALHITVMPVTLGSGTPLLPHTASTMSWHLDEARPIGSAGAVELRYRVRSA